MKNNRFYYFVGNNIIDGGENPTFHNKVDDKYQEKFNDLVNKTRSKDDKRSCVDERKGRDTNN